MVTALQYAATLGMSAATWTSRRLKAILGQPKTCAFPDRRLPGAGGLQSNQLPHLERKIIGDLRSRHVRQRTAPWDQAISLHQQPLWQARRWTWKA